MRKVFEFFSKLASKYGISWATVGGSLIGSFFARMVMGLIGFVSKRLLITFVVLPAMVLVTSTIFFAIKASIFSLVLTLPPNFNQAMSMVIPSNFHLCINIIVATETAVWVWRWVVKFIEMYAK
jgi:hypothetical protein